MQGLFSAEKTHAESYHRFGSLTIEKPTVMKLCDNGTFERTLDYESMSSDDSSFCGDLNEATMECYRLNTGLNLSSIDIAPKMHQSAFLPKPIDLEKSRKLIEETNALLEKINKNEYVVNLSENIVPPNYKINVIKPLDDSTFACPVSEIQQRQQYTQRTGIPFKDIIVDRNKSLSEQLFPAPVASNNVFQNRLNSLMPKNTFILNNAFQNDAFFMPPGNLSNMFRTSNLPATQTNVTASGTANVNALNKSTATLINTVAPNVSNDDALNKSTASLINTMAHNASTKTLHNVSHKLLPEVVASDASDTNATSLKTTDLNKDSSDASDSNAKTTDLNKDSSDASDSNATSLETTDLNKDSSDASNAPVCKPPLHPQTHSFRRRRRKRYPKKM